MTEEVHPREEERKTASIKLEVKTRTPGWTFQQFIDSHSSMPKKWLTDIDELTPNHGFVTVNYRAIGSSKEDVMRAYTSREKWQRWYVDNVSKNVPVN